MARSEGALIIDNEAASVRRELGPLAWFVLEELALSSDRPAGVGPRARVGVRDLAASLGMSKDTVARGLARLIETGVATRVVGRSGTGRFASSHYEVHLPVGVTLLTPQSGNAGAEPPAQRSKRSRNMSSSGRAKPTSQLTLLDQAAAGDG